MQMQERVTRETVEGWVEDFGLQHQPHPMDDNPRFEWGLSVGGQAFGTIVAQLQVEFNYLTIQAPIAISKKHQAALRSLDDDTRTAFLYDLRLALHWRAVGHMIEFHIDESGTPTNLPVRVTLGMDLVEQPMARIDFFKANRIVQTGAAVVALTFQKMAH